MDRSGTEPHGSGTVIQSDFTGTTPVTDTKRDRKARKERLSALLKWLGDSGGDDVESEPRRGRRHRKERKERRGRGDRRRRRRRSSSSAGSGGDRRERREEREREISPEVVLERAAARLQTGDRPASQRITSPPPRPPIVQVSPRDHLSPRDHFASRMPASPHGGALVACDAPVFQPRRSVRRKGNESGTRYRRASSAPPRDSSPASGEHVRSRSVPQSDGGVWRRLYADALLAMRERADLSTALAAERLVGLAVEHEGLRFHPETLEARAVFEDLRLRPGRVFESLHSDAERQRQRLRLLTAQQRALGPVPHPVVNTHRLYPREDDRLERTTQAWLNSRRAAARPPSPQLRIWPDVAPRYLQSAQVEATLPLSWLRHVFDSTPRRAGLGGEPRCLDSRDRGQLLATLECDRRVQRVEELRLYEPDEWKRRSPRTDFSQLRDQLLATSGPSVSWEEFACAFSACTCPNEEVQPRLKPTLAEQNKAVERLYKPRQKDPPRQRAPTFGSGNRPTRQPAAVRKAPQMRAAPPSSVAAGLGSPSRATEASRLTSRQSMVASQTSTAVQQPRQPTPAPVGTASGASGADPSSRHSVREDDDVSSTSFHTQKDPTPATPAHPTGVAHSPKGAADQRGSPPKAGRGSSPPKLPLRLSVAASPPRPGTGRGAPSPLAVEAAKEVHAPAPAVHAPARPAGRGGGGRGVAVVSLLAHTRSPRIGHAAQQPAPETPTLSASTAPAATATARPAAVPPASAPTPASASLSSRSPAKMPLLPNAALAGIRLAGRGRGSPTPPHTRTSHQTEQTPAPVPPPHFQLPSAPSATAPAPLPAKIPPTKAPPPMVAGYSPMRAHSSPSTPMGLMTKGPLPAGLKAPPQGGMKTPIRAVSPHMSVTPPSHPPPGMPGGPVKIPPGSMQSPDYSPGHHHHYHHSAQRQQYHHHHHHHHQQHHQQHHQHHYQQQQQHHHHQYHQHHHQHHHHHQHQLHHNHSQPAPPHPYDNASPQPTAQPSRLPGGIRQPTVAKRTIVKCSHCGMDKDKGGICRVTNQPHQPPRNRR
eukprot:Hpha_TRINITY_DN15396_c0_g1::TRINITY_DN15396_c0_g1_i1::g.88864::m.88864